MRIVDGKPLYTGYLIGSICHAKDREHAFDASERAVIEAGHEALNPVKEEPYETGMSCTDSESKLNQLWREQKFTDYRALMDAIWMKDLDNVRKADYLVLHFEQGDASVGAPLEMTMASLIYLLRLAQKSCESTEKTWLSAAKHALDKAGFSHKPIYWICQGPISDTNSTLRWLVLSGSDVKVFKTYKELSEFLKRTYK